MALSMLTVLWSRHCAYLQRSFTLNQNDAPTKYILLYPSLENHLSVFCPLCGLLGEESCSLYPFVTGLFYLKYIITCFCVRSMKKNGRKGPSDRKPITCQTARRRSVIHQTEFGLICVHLILVFARAQWLYYVLYVYCCLEIMLNAHLFWLTCLMIRGINVSLSSSKVRMPRLMWV